MLVNVVELSEETTTAIVATFAGKLRVFQFFTVSCFSGGLLGEVRRVVHAVRTAPRNDPDCTLSP